MKKITLQSNKILNMKFKTELSGYSPDEVDKYLDLILDDYTKFEDKINNLEKELHENKEIIKQNIAQQDSDILEIDNLKSQVEESTNTITNTILEKLDDIKRIVSKL